MLREEQIKIRRERAQKEAFRIVRKGDHPVYSDFEVTNLGTKQSYRVAIRGFQIGDNYCSCPDYRKNTLGTCKHIEAVLLHLLPRTSPRERQHGATLPFAEVYLAYGKELELRIKLPERASQALRLLAVRNFCDDGKMPPRLYPGFPTLLEAFQQLEDRVVVYPDAMAHVERELEIRQDLVSEREALQKLAAGELELDVLKVPLYDYQKRGVLFAAYRGRSVLGDDMGLGKTVQAIGAAELLARHKGIAKVLVISPASVKWQWATEIRKFTDRTARVIEGLHKDRANQYTQPEFFKLANYEMVLRDVPIIQAWGPDLIILDEAQRIKNWQTKTAKAVKSLRSRYAIVLTGTPLENKVEELYSIVEFADDRRLGPPFQFLADHVKYDDRGKLIGYTGLDQIRERLAPIFLRRRRDEVLTQLPERIDNTYWVPMRPEQVDPHEEQRAALARIIAKWKRQKWLSELDHKRIMCCLQNMRMLCDSTFLYDKETNVSPKLEEFEPLVDEWVLQGDQKMLVFSQWEMMTRLISQLLARMRVGHVSLHGGVPSKKRGGLLEQFREDAQCKVFLSTDAGGVGLNLQAASVVLNFDVPWNPAILEQRIGRAHRMGQRRTVHVIHLVSRGGIEERVLLTAQLKRDLFKGLFDGTATEVSFEALGRERFMQMVESMVGPTIVPVLGAQPGLPTESAEQVTIAETTFEEPARAAAPMTPVPAAPTPRIELPEPVRQAGQGLLQAGLQFLSALGGGAAAAGAARPAAVVEGVTRQLAGGLTNLVRRDPATGQPSLTIPIPDPEALQRGLSQLGQLLGALFRGQG